MQLRQPWIPIQDAKTYSLLKTEDDSEADFAADYNEADMDAQFENLDFANYEMRYSTYDK